MNDSKLVNFLLILARKLTSKDIVVMVLKWSALLYANSLIIQLFQHIFHLLETTSLIRLQISLLVGLGIPLFLMLRILSDEKRREKFFAWTRKYFNGWVLFVYSFTFLYVATGFFGSVTYLLVKKDILSWLPENQKMTIDAISNFYFWHFVDAIPILKVNSTLRVQEPLTYDNGGVGFLVLLFKIVVISPVIASFIWYRQFVAKEKKEEPPKGKAQKIVYRIVRPRRRTLHP